MKFCHCRLHCVLAGATVLTLAMAAQHPALAVAALSVPAFNKVPAVPNQAAKPDAATSVPETKNNPPAPSQGAGKAPDPSAQAITLGTSSQTNYQGDHITFPIWIYSKKITGVDGEGQYPTKGACIAPGTELQGYAASNDGYLFRVLTPQDSSPAKVDGCATTEPLKRNDMVDITTGTIDLFPPNRFGWAYGALAVPFKMQLSKTNDIQASATLGPYLGYTFNHESVGFSFTPLAFLGPTIFNVSKTAGVQATSSTGFGISAGIGTLFVIKDNFQIGVVAGYDHAGPNSGYLYNDRFWLSAALGLAFH